MVTPLGHTTTTLGHRRFVVRQSLVPYGEPMGHPLIAGWIGHPHPQRPTGDLVRGCPRMILRAVACPGLAGRTW